MAVLTVTASDRAGTLRLDSLEVAANGGGDSMPTTGVEMVEFNNTGGGSITITEVFQVTIDGQALTNRTVVLPPTGRVLLGPYDTTQYGDGNGRVNFTYTGVTGLKVCAFKKGST